MAEPEPGSGAASAESASSGELMVRLSRQLSDLVRGEMELARAELRESVKHGGLGAGMFGAAGVLALYGLGALIATAILALAVVLDGWLAALIVTVVLFAAAGVAALVGKREIGRTAPPVQESVDSVKADVETVKRSKDRNERGTS